jgi:osmoprotectant transport system permease protein
MNADAEAVFQAWQSAEFWHATMAFVELVFQGLGVALLLGIPGGIALTRFPRVAAPVIGLFGLLQTFPSMALLGLCIPWLGLKWPAYIFLTVVYSLFPIVLNTYVGITQVAPAIRDAARGMGMTGGQILRNVDLPLAFPVILAGVRTAAVYAIGIITVCALAGAGGLGGFVVRGMDRGDNALLWIGAIPILLLTLLVFLALGAIARLAKANSRLGLAVGGALIGALALYAAAVAPGKLFEEREHLLVRLGSKNFAEGEILSEILKQMLEQHTDLDVQITKPDLAPSLIFKAIRNDDIDLYPEYTGNLLTSKDALDLAVPADKSTITPLVRRGILRRFGLVLLDTFGLNNTYALCVPRKTARRYGLRTISDLRKVPSFRVAVDLDFPDRPDGWKGLVKTYGLRLPAPIPVAPGLRYRALGKRCEVVCGFATDWQLADSALDLVVLEDDKHYFPDYRAAPLIREEVLERHPKIREVLERLKGQIDDRTMRRLNYDVARNHLSAAEAARRFLKKKGLLEPVHPPSK